MNIVKVIILATGLAFTVNANADNLCDGFRDGIKNAYEDVSFPKKLIYPECLSNLSLWHDYDDGYDDGYAYWEFFGNI